MLGIKKTKTGWIWETTNGGRCNRRALYKRSTLTRLGIDYNADPYAVMAGNDIGPVDFLSATEPDQILSIGTVIG